MTVKSILCKIGIDTSEFEAGMKKVNSQADDFKKVGMAMTAVGGLLTGFFAMTVKDAGASEVAQAKLRAELEKMPGAVKGGADELINYAGQLQHATGIEDDQIVSAQALLATFGLNEKQIMALTPRMLDMATSQAQATGSAVNLTEAAHALGMAVNGHVAILTRHGVILSENTKATGDFNLILKDCDTAFGGLSIRVGQTFAGQMSIAKYEVKDMMKAIGENLLPILTPLFAKIASGAHDVKTWTDSHKEFMAVLTPVTAGLGAMLLICGPIVAFLPKLVLGFQAATAALGPFGLVVVALVATGAALGAVIAILDHANAVSNDSAMQNLKLESSLYKIWHQAGLTRDAFNELSAKCNGNMELVRQAILNDEAGAKAKELLVAALKKASAAVETEGKVNQANADKIIALRKGLTDAIVKSTQTAFEYEKFSAQQTYEEKKKEIEKETIAGKERDALVLQAGRARDAQLFAASKKFNDEQIAMRKSLSDEIAKATLDDFGYQKRALSQELIAKQKKISDEIADEKERSAQMLLVQNAYNAKVDALEKTEQEKRLNANIAFKNKLRDQELEQRNVEIQVAQEIVDKRADMAKMVNRLTLGELDYKKWENTQELAAEVDKIEKTLNLTRDEKDRLIAIWKQFYLVKGQTDKAEAIKAMNIYREMSQALTQILGSIGSIIQGNAQSEIAALDSSFNAATAGFKKVQDAETKAYNAAYDVRMGKVTSEYDAKKKAIDDDYANKQAAINNNITDEAARAAALTALEAQHNDAVQALAKAQADEEAKAAGDKAAFEQKQADDAAKRESDLASQKERIQRQAARAQKAIAMITAGINIAEAITKALTGGVPPWNFVLAGITAAAGAVQLAAIAAAPLAGGGIVDRPTLALIGEAGPEAVVPLRGARGMALASAGGMTIRMTNHFYGDVRSEDDIDRMSVQLSAKIKKVMNHRRR